MDDLIIGYIQDRFTDELQEEIIRSFDLFDFFEYNQAYSGFVDILMNASYESSESTQDKFISELHKKLDYVLQQHTIVTVEDTDIWTKNELLTALGRLQHLEDYSAVIHTLESMVSDEEELSIILSDVCALDEQTVMSAISEFNPTVLETLKTYIYQIESERDVSTERPLKLIEGLRLFTTEVCKDSIVAKLLQSGLLPGQRFETYLSFVQSDLHVENNTVKTAENILSLLIASSDGYNAPITVYRKYSMQILGNLNLVTEVEVKILGLIAKYSEIKKVNDEKARLSSASAQT